MSTQQHAQVTQPNNKLWTIVFTVMQLLFDGLVAYCAIRGIPIAIGELEATRKSVAQTDTSIKEVVDQTAAAQGQLAEMANQTGAMQAQIKIAADQLKEAIAATRVARESADAAKVAAAASQESNLIAANATRQDLRAYVNIVTDDNPKLAPILSGGTLVAYSLELKVQNAGKTPAHRVNIYAGTKCLPPDFKGPFNWSTINGKNMTLGPNRNTTLSLPTPVTAGDRSDGHVVWVYGTIYYEALGFPVFTNFRYRQVGVGRNELRIEDQGNESDDWNFLGTAPGALKPPQVAPCPGK